MSSKIILVTGASTGFGNITAKLLAKNGHTVYATLYNTSSQTITAMMAAPNIPNKPEQVAAAIVKLVDMPNGTRPLRTVVDKMIGGVTEIINETAKQVQAGVLQNFGLSELNINN